MGDGNNLRKSVYPNCELCLKEIIRKYRLAKGAIGTQTLARFLPPCPHKKVKSNSAKRSFKKGVKKK